MGLHSRFTTSRPSGPEILAASPDFGYDMCVRRVTDEQLATLDLPRVDAAVNGSEPVRAGTLNRFQERFGPTDFRPEAMLPMYGPAEATLMASGSGGRRPVTTLVGARRAWNRDSSPRPRPRSRPGYSPAAGRTPAHRR